MLARARAARVDLALVAARLREATRIELNRAHAEVIVGRAWLIGSLAWGEYGAGSDVDVVVEGVSPQGIDELWARLSRTLGERLDLLRLEELPPSFRARVLSEGIAIA